MTQIQIQFATCPFILQDMLVDGFMTNAGPAFPFQSAADLLRAPLLLKHDVDVAHQFPPQFNSFRLLCMTLFGLLVRLLIG